MGLFAFLLKRKFLYKMMLATGLAWLLLASSSPLPQWLINNLEKKYQALQLEGAYLDSIKHILVLGGGSTISPNIPASLQLSGTSLIRLAEGIRIYQSLDSVKLVFSGYSRSKRTTIAELGALAAIELGVASEDTIQLRDASNTWDEIVSFKRRYGKGPVILVTSASHMPRAMMLCKFEGVQALAAPTDFLLKHDSQKWAFEFLPSVQKLEMTQRVLHEWLATLKWKILK